MLRKTMTPVNNLYDSFAILCLLSLSLWTSIAQSINCHRLFEDSPVSADSQSALVFKADGTSRPMQAVLSMKNKVAQLSESQLAEARLQASSFYLAARIFTSTWGKAYADLALEFATKNPHKKVKVVVALGGAEHLGNLVEYAAHLRQIKNVEVIPVHLNSRIMSAWRGLKRIGDKEITTAGFFPPRDGTIQVTAPNKAMIESSDRAHYLEDQQKLVDYLNERGCFSGDHVVVLDTGIMGTAVNVVAEIANASKGQPSVEGVYVFQVGSDHFHSPVPIRSLNVSANEGIVRNLETETSSLVEGSPRYWSSMLDNMGPIASGQNFYSGFQRGSHGIPAYHGAREVIDDDGVPYVQPVEFLQRGDPKQKQSFVSRLFGTQKVVSAAIPFQSQNALENYRDNLAGIRDGLD